MHPSFFVYVRYWPKGPLKVRTFLDIPTNSFAHSVHNFSYIFSKISPQKVASRLTLRIFMLSKSNEESPHKKLNQSYEERNCAIN